jgi:hemolysin III
MSELAPSRTCPPHLVKERPYTRAEVISDGVVHGVALSSAVIAGAILVWLTWQVRNAVEVSAVTIYAVALVCMLSCSMAYNLTPDSPRKWFLRRFDLSGIYLMIAGTYTPLLTQVADPFTAWALAATVWGGAIAGIVAAIGFPAFNEKVKLIGYLFLGWVAVLALQPLMASLSAFTFSLMVVGGLLYTIGVIFWRWNSLKFQNVIWHGFVVTAAGCHYVAIRAAMGV